MIDSSDRSELTPLLLLSLSTVKCILQLSIRRAANRTNRVKLGYPMIILPVYESPGGRTLPFEQGIAEVPPELLMAIVDMSASATRRSACQLKLNYPSWSLGSYQPVSNNFGVACRHPFLVLQIRE